MRIMKKICFLSALFSVNYSSACINCNKSLQQAIYDSTFYPNLMVMLSAFFVLALLVILLSWLSARKYKRYTVQSPSFFQNAEPGTTDHRFHGIGNRDGRFYRRNLAASNPAMARNALEQGFHRYLTWKKCEHVLGRYFSPFLLDGSSHGKYLVVETLMAEGCKPFGEFVFRRIAAGLGIIQSDGRIN